jgi:putative transposase
MPNHLHFLVRIKDEAVLETTFGKFETFQKLEARLSKQFANLFSSYTQAINKMYSRKGSLFIPNFKRKQIEEDAYLTNTVIYIHRNPSHHKIMQDYTAWCYSSYRAILSDKVTLIRRDEVLEWFGNREEFIKLHEQTDGYEPSF